MGLVVVVETSQETGTEGFKFEPGGSGMTHKDPLSPINKTDFRAILTWLLGLNWNLMLFFLLSQSAKGSVIKL